MHFCLCASAALLLQTWCIWPIFFFLLIVLSVPDRGGRRGRLAVFPVGDALMSSPGGKRRSLAVSLPPLCHSALTTASKVTERRRSPLSFRDISRVASLGSEFDFSCSRFVGTCSPRKSLKQEVCDTGSVCTCARST